MPGTLTLTPTLSMRYLPGTMYCVYVALVHVPNHTRTSIYNVLVSVSRYTDTRISTYTI